MSDIPRKLDSFYQRVSEKPFFDAKKGLYRLFASSCLVLTGFVLLILNIIYKDTCWRLSLLNTGTIATGMSSVVIYIAAGFFNSKLISTVEVVYIFLTLVFSFIMFIWNIVWLAQFSEGCLVIRSGQFVFAINVIQTILQGLIIICLPCIMFLSFIQFIEILGFSWRKRFDRQIPKVNQMADAVFFDNNDFTDSEALDSVIEMPRNNELVSK